MSKYNNKFYLFANWKMYLGYSESVDLARSVSAHADEFKEKVKMVIFPSALALKETSEVFTGKDIGTGAQNVYWVDKGGYTGEISSEFARDAGAKYALVGHSERRHLFHESNHETREKIEAVLTAGLTPVLCVGETAEERKNEQTLEILEVQTRAALDGIVWPDGRELIVAYEPVWAIGTGDSCPPGEAEKAQEYLFRLIKELIPGILPVLLYGGSVRANNVKDYLKEEHINGVLVGGASAKEESWLDIIKAAYV